MFWTNNPRILFNNNNYLKFFPKFKNEFIRKIKRYYAIIDIFGYYISFSFKQLSIFYIFQL